MRLLLIVCCGALVLAGGGCQLVAGFSSTAVDGRDARHDVATVEGGVDAAADGLHDSRADGQPDSRADGGPDAPLPGGSHLWSRRLGLRGTVTTMVTAADSAGNTFIGGAFRGRVDVGGGELSCATGSGLFAASYAPDGAHRWTCRVGCSSDQASQIIDVDVGEDGGVYLVGQLRGVIAFDDGPLTSAGDSDILAVRLEAASGAYCWARSCGGVGTDVASSVAVGDAGRFYLTGSFSGALDCGGGALTSAGSTDVLLAAFDSAGMHAWYRGIGGAGADAGQGIAVDDSGALRLIGYFSDTVAFDNAALTSAGDRDLFVASLPGDTGSGGWARGFGGAGRDHALDIAVDGDGTAYGVGVFTGTIDFQVNALTAAGDADGFVASFAADGGPLWAFGFGGAGGDYGNRVAVDSDGWVYVAGAFSETADPGGGMLTSAGASDGFVASYEPGGVHRWTVHFGGSGTDLPSSLAVAPSGALQLTGIFQRELQLGGSALTGTGTFTHFLASLDADTGAYVRSRGFAGFGAVEGLAAAFDSAGNPHVVGTFEGTLDIGGGGLIGVDGKDSFVISLDAAGAPRWSGRCAGDGTTLAQGVAVDASGNVYVFGHFGKAMDCGGSALSSAGLEDIFLASFASDGGHRWSRRFGGGGTEHARGVAVDQQGNVYAVGFFTGSTDLGGGELASAGQTDLFVASFRASDGAHRWSRAAGGAAWDLASSVAADADGNVYVAGQRHGTINLGGKDLVGMGSADGFLASYAGVSGSHRWSRNLAGAGHDDGRAVAVDASGNVFVVGTFDQPLSVGGGELVSAGAADIFVASYAPNGAHRWSRGAGGALLDQAHGVAAAPGGDVYVLGTFTGEADFGGGSLQSVGDSDLFVVRYAAADGAYRWAQRLGGSADEAATGIAASAAAVLVAGRFDQLLELGGASLWGINAGFVAALAP